MTRFHTRFVLATGKKFGVTHFINPKDLGEKTVSQVITHALDPSITCFT
jgi:Zn-dependent alcohol dehydrogenase